MSIDPRYQGLPSPRPRGGVLVEHPDGHQSVIPCEVVDGELIAAVPAGCRIANLDPPTLPGSVIPCDHPLQFPTPPLDATDQAQRNAAIRGIIDDIPTDHVDVEQVHRDLSGQQRRAATVEDNLDPFAYRPLMTSQDLSGWKPPLDAVTVEVSPEQLLSLIQKEAGALAKLLTDPPGMLGRHDVLIQLGEIRRLAIKLPRTLQP